VRQRKTYLVHDEESARMPGDVVRIEQCRPLSKRKHFTIVEVVREAERLVHPRLGKVVTKATL
jgi:small subunit ribosomal protein S17